MFILPELPYAKNALEPYISEETLEYHYGKHHQGYVNKLNELVKGTSFESEESLLVDEEMIKTAAGSVFNNAAQIWNHHFYWQCLTPKGNKNPSGSLMIEIEKTFGSFNNFKTAFNNSALSNFGSGWTWLVKNSDNKLEIVNTSNADNPIINRQKPLLTCDVWEHAYYIDYRNNRAEYLENLWSIINWTFVEENYEK